MKSTKTTISKSEAIRKGNDGKNQDIKQKFVGREVFCNVNSLVQYCLSKGFEDSENPVNIDDIENYYAIDSDKAIEDIIELWCDKNEEMIEYANDPDTYNRRVKTEGDFRVFLNSLEGHELFDCCESFGIEPETNPQQIFEWWAVSSFLFDKLRAEGCVVIDTGSCKVWGRCTTGQAILLDGVITRICADMEILQGQENAWL